MTSPSSQEIAALNSAFARGSLGDAEALARAMTARHPRAGIGWQALGSALAQMGRLQEAVAPLQQACQRLPGNSDVFCDLGLALSRLGRPAEAESSYRQAVQINPADPAAHDQLGLSLRALGRLAEAQACHEKALAIAPGYAHAHNNLGVVLQSAGQIERAQACFRRAIEIDPNYAEACNNLGGVLQSLQRPLDAVPCFRQALRINPNYATAHNNLGASLKGLGQLDEAEACIRRALALRPDYVEAMNNLGLVLQDQGRLDEAEAAFRRALQTNPLHAGTHGNLGVLLRQLSRFGESEASLRRALQLDPGHAPTCSNLGSLLLVLGHFGEAEQILRQALQRDPDLDIARSNLLFAMNYTQTDGSVQLAAAREFGRRVTERARLRYGSWSCPQGVPPLRVGLVSGDFREHPVGYFLENVLANVDPGRIQFFAYATLHQSDAVTARLRTLIPNWRRIAGMDDEAAARRIHDDGVHILIDLAGHSAENRLALFASKPAPVQVSWLGYFATTGVAQIDYLLADSLSLPKSQEAFFTETIWRMPETRLCFTVPDVDIGVAPLPALASGNLTFGCFNNLTKINDPVVATWARILAAVPGSRLFLKSPQLADPAVRDQTIERFRADGVDAGRLVLEGPSARGDYLAAYHRVDLALDPFPYTGGATTAEALWMGVPVLTLTGETMIGRQGAALVTHAGLQDWIARDPDDYVARALRHAAGLEALAALRRGLRERVLASPIFDGARFARNLENELSAMWQRHAESARGHPVADTTPAGMPKAP